MAGHDRATPRRRHTRTVRVAHSGVMMAPAPTTNCQEVPMDSDIPIPPFLLIWPVGLRAVD